jgi:hypothetical protein
MDQQPITPPIGAAGIDLAGPDCTPTGSTCSWAGLTIEQAEKTLCQSTNQGDLFGDGNLANSWGDSGEVLAHYLITTHKIDFLDLEPGYLGAISATGCTGTMSEGHTYTFPVQVQVQKDNQNWELDWSLPKGPQDWRNEVTSAILCTYAPTLAHDPDCNASGRCIQGSFGDVAYLYIPLVGVGLWIPSQSAPQPQPSILAQVEMDLAKVTPFAAATPNLKIDAVGPTANAGLLNQGGQPCNMQFGATFGDFLTNCVKATGNQTQDTAEYNKLIGGIQHNNERFFFNITGVDLNFADTHLQPTQVVNDTDLPQSDDVAGEFSIDQSTVGAIVQDYVRNDPTQKKDAHGNGLVYLQAARLAQRDLNALMKAGNPSFAPHYIGDPACADPSPAAGCTGLETIITTAPQAFITATQTVPGAGPSSVTAQEVTTLVNAGLPAGTDIMDPNAPAALTIQRLGMKPGTANVAFCPDHTNLIKCPTTYRGLTFQTVQARVLAILGGGNLAKLPVEAQDVRFFFKEYVTALLQYLEAEGAATTAGKDPSAVTVADIDSIVLNEYALFFDSLGAGQFEEAEYIDRSTATDTAPPIDFVFSADVKHGIMNGYTFSRYLYRGETAMYSAMVDERDGKAHPLGQQDTALLTNMFGSPVLRTGWKDHTADSGSKYTAYYCATNYDPTPCKGDVPPHDASDVMLVDEEGNPLLSHYEGAFAGSQTPFTLGGGQSTSQPVPVALVKNSGDTGTGTFANIQSAYIEVPLHANPYNLTSGPPVGGGSAIQKLVPWAPKQPGIGFPVALDGQRNKFIETYQMDLSGSQITANIDYDFKLDQNGNPTTSLMFLAVETTDFLGDLFVCRDAATGDLLTARMYTSVSSLLEWITAHPGSYDACNLILQYSPYENYLDYVTSLSSGVRLGVTQGGGYGRIVDGTLFDPSLPNH